MNIYFLIAGGGAFVITLLHVFGGGPAVAAPMMASPALDPVVRYTNYYCWHLVTVSLALMAAAFVWAAVAPAAWEAAVLGGVMALLFCAWGLALVRIKQQRYRDMPQGWLFAPVALLGLYGFIA